MYPVTNPNPLTKLQFAVEELYNYYVREGHASETAEKADESLNKA